MYFTIKYAASYYCEMSNFANYQWYLKKFCKHFSTKEEAKETLREVRKEFKEAKIIKIWERGELFQRIKVLEKQVRNLTNKVDYLEGNLNKVSNDMGYLTVWHTPF